MKVKIIQALGGLRMSDCCFDCGGGAWGCSSRHRGHMMMKPEQAAGATRDALLQVVAPSCLFPFLALTKIKSPETGTYHNE